MKISLNTIKWLNQHYGSAGDIAVESVDTLVEKIGAQLGGVDEVIRFGSKYDGIKIVDIVECEPHPNADKLKVCKVDDGSSQLTEVVCGAPNVRTGMKAAWLPPGATVPETYGKEPFVLEARELRGVVSNGMLASPKELALGDSHDGILEIDGDHAPGTDFAEAFGLKDDVIIDIENKMFTHRPDCFGYLGIARELSGIHHQTYKSPEYYALQPEFPAVEAEALPLTVVNEIPSLVPRFSVIALRDVKVGPSPVWLQVELAKVGLRSINNIVDYTNYFMLETGQPLHAYDYDKPKAFSDGEPSLVIRNPKPGEKITLLNGKTVEPRAEAIMIATDKQLVGIGGVMGGGEIVVDDTTTNVVIEAASFDMYSIRRSVMAHGLFTDAATRFTKGQSPLQTLAVLAKIVDKVRHHAGGKVAGPLIDNCHLDQSILDRGSLHVPVTVTTGFINDRLGLSLSADEMKQLLENVEFNVAVNDQDLSVSAPFWRTDIELREDVIEEIGRLYGYDHLPLELPLRGIKPTTKDVMLSLKADIRSCLAKAGANEVLTYSFVHGDLVNKVGQDTAKAYQVSNALSPDLQYYRLSLTASLLEKVHPNIKSGYDSFALFGIGRSHNIDYLDDEGLPKGNEKIGLVFAANPKAAPSGAAYYQAKQYLEVLAQQFGLRLGYEPVNDELVFETSRPFEPGRSADVRDLDSGKVIGIIGEFKTSVRQALKLPVACAGFEIATTHLSPKPGTASAYRPLSRFPSIKQDVTLQVGSELPFAKVHEVISASLAAHAPEDSHVEVEALGVFQKQDDPAHKNLSFRITLTGNNRTLTDQAASAVVEALAADAVSELQAQVV